MSQKSHSEVLEWSARFAGLRLQQPWNFDGLGSRPETGQCMHGWKVQKKALPY